MEHDRPRRDILTAQADMPARRGRLEDRDQISLPPGRLDLDHGISSLRERRAGRDLNRHAGLDDDPAPPSGPGLADAAENGGVIRRGPERLFAPHCIAVHRRAVERGNRLGRHDVPGQDPLRAIPEIDLLRAQPLHLTLDQREDIAHRRPGAEPRIRGS